LDVVDPPATAGGTDLIQEIRAKNCTKTTLERKLHRQLHLPRIAHTLSQEPVKVE
jgi:hypothetical protein